CAGADPPRGRRVPPVPEADLRAPPRPGRGRRLLLFLSRSEHLLAVRDAAARPDARRGRGGAAGGDRVAQDGGRAGGGTRTREESGRGEFRLAPGFRALARLEPGALRADGVVAAGGSVR